MSYVTVFEITRDESLWWWPLLFGTLIFALIATIILLLTQGLSFITMIVRFVVFLFACLWIILASYPIRYRSRMVQAYRNGNYAVIEGRVEHYSWKGKTECFSVHGVRFCRGTGNPVLRWPIGFLREDLPVRIAYFDDKTGGEISEASLFPRILRLDVGGNSR